MSQVIVFETSLFDVKEEKENPINPIPGQSLLAWLRGQLKEKQIMSKPYPEDWGWCSELEYKGSFYFIGASTYPDEDGQEGESKEWTLQIHKKRTFMERLFGKNKIKETDYCYLLFKGLLEKESQIKII